tara:strand:+ start:2290 stop:2505 length:216 start_codon:yes stop_codon:yes gene_type:complete
MIVEEAKKFKPIELTITIETEEELCDLWHRMNATKPEIDNDIHDTLKHRSSSNMVMWGSIDNLVKVNNLYK